MIKGIKKFKLTKSNIIYLYVIVYFLLNLIFLTKFPFMHSDESWLSGLTRSMQAGGLGSTEYFFNTLPRYPHAIKSVFHLLQMGFISIFGYNLFAVRLISLLFGVISVLFFYKLVLKLSKSINIAILITVIFSLDVQIIYASHLARQEIIIVAIMLGAFYYVIRNIDRWNYKNDIKTGIIVGLSVGIHPNSFMIALCIGILYIYFLAIKRKLNIKNLGVLMAVVSGITLLFIALSFAFDRQFIMHYLTYGDNLGVVNNSIPRLQGFLGYMSRLYRGSSVTYYLPSIRLQMLIFGMTVLTGVVHAIKSENRYYLMLVLPIIAICVGFILIGRYSQPGIVLLFPFCYILLALIVRKPEKGGITLLCIVGLTIIGFASVDIYNNTNNDYDEYVQNITNEVPNDAVVLANLNTEFAFDYGKLIDYRNLEFMGEDSSFAEYIETYDIEYIIYPEEMDFIYIDRPTWNIMYGNIYPYYDDMQKFFMDECDFIGDFYSPYAMRIVNVLEDKDWYVKIYKVR